MITFRALLATGFTLLASMPAPAQTVQQPPRPERPYRGIFAGGMNDSGQSLTGQATLSGGYDDNVLAQATNRANSSIRDSQEGSFGQFTGGLNYALTGDRGSVNAMAGTSQRYYPSLQNDYFKTYQASLGGMVRVTTKPEITLNQSVAYRPYTFLDVLPSAIEPPPGAAEITEPDFVPVSNHFVSYNGGADLRQPITQRVTFNLGWNYQTTDRLSHQFLRQTGNANVSVGMTRDLSLRLGYRYTRADYGDRITEVHRPDVGLDFARALSLTRRTSLTFGVGTEATVYQDRTRFHAVGNVNVLHEIGRSWTAGGTYQRGTYFVATLSEPITGDSGSVQLNGLITRRLNFSATAGASTGQMGFGSGHDFDSYRGSLSLSTALNRFMNVGVDYAYYKYVFDSAVVLEPGLASDINRQSIRAHISFWAPIFNKARRPNASR
jgi:hypothetical protein